MKRFTIDVTIKCNRCNKVKPLSFSGLGESHAEHFTMARKTGSLSWSCGCLSDITDHVVLALKITEV